MAAHCAHTQGLFWEYHDAIFDNPGALEDAQLKKFAVDLGMDTERFDACLDSNEFADEVQAEAQVGQKLGVTGTPAFFINGRFLSGARPLEAFQQVIDEELARSES